MNGVGGLAAKAVADVTKSMDEKGGGTYGRTRGESSNASLLLGPAPTASGGAKPPSSLS